MANNSIHYFLVENGEKKFYTFSYKDLRDKYRAIVDYTDAEFLANLPEILHFACFVAWVKDLPSEATLSDVGIVHELAHLLHLGENEEVKLRSIREKFNKYIKLA